MVEGVCILFLLGLAVPGKVREWSRSEKIESDD
jgi:hypothetical protein